jgi:hypothetical protein
MKKALFIISAFLISGSFADSIAQTAVQKMEAVNFSQVEIQDNFWKPRIHTVSTVTIPVCIDQIL